MADDSKLFAFLAIFLGLIGFILVILTKKDDKYAMYYAKQSLVLVITAFILYFVGFILSLITLGIGFFFIMPLIWIVVVVLWVIGIVYAFSGEEKPIPVIGKFGEKFNF